MADIKRIFPEGKSALINWIEENFHEIDSYVATFRLNGSTMTVYHVNDYVEGLGLGMVTLDTMQQTSAMGEFVTKPKE